MLSTFTVPPNFSTIRRVIERPNPCPLIWTDFRVVKGLDSSFFSAVGMPLPLSRIQNLIMLFSKGVKPSSKIGGVPPYLMALLI